MMLNLSPDLDLPTEAVTQTFSILAKRGVGKTYTASVMVEEMLKNNLQVVVVDPIGVWHGLRTSADGQNPGFPIIIAGGEHGDVPLEPTNGEVIADLIIDNQLSMVIDLSLMRKNEQKRFMVDFAETLYHRNRTAMHLVLDEADEWAPQRTIGDEARLLGAIEDLVRRGRARGIGVTLITQRPAVLNKNVLTQIEVLVAMRLTSPQDRNAINEWVKYHADEDKSKEMIFSLPSLPVGTAWFWSPGWLDIFKKVAIRKRETFDSSSTPEVGVKIIEEGKRAAVKIDNLREKLTETIQKAEENDPKRLKARIRELEQRLKSEVRVEMREVEVVPDFVSETIGQLSNSIVNLELDLKALQEKINTLPTHKSKHFREIQQQVKTGTISDHAAAFSVALDLAESGNDKTITQTPDKSSANGSLKLAERKVLIALAQYPQGRNVRQLAILTGYSHRGGGFNNALSSLRTKGYIQGKGDISITQEGLDVNQGNWEPLPKGRELVNYWLNELSLAPRKILDYAVYKYPHSINVSEAAEATGYAAGGGGFNNALSRLRTLGLIEGHGNIKASNIFFEEE